MAERLVLKFKKLHPEAVLPSYAHDDDAGMDLFSIEKKVLKPGEHYLFKTGVAAEIPPGYFVSVRDKSGLAAKHGLHVLGGVIDSGYRGEWATILINLGQEEYTIEKGDKLSQAILQPIEHAQILAVDRVSETVRGQGGFGSTGRK